MACALVSTVLQAPVSCVITGEDKSGWGNSVCLFVCTSSLQHSDASSKTNSCNYFWEVIPTVTIEEYENRVTFWKILYDGNCFQDLGSPFVQENISTSMPGHEQKVYFVAHPVAEPTLAKCNVNNYPPPPLPTHGEEGSVIICIQATFVFWYWNAQRR